MCAKMKDERWRWVIWLGMMGTARDLFEYGWHEYIGQAVVEAPSSLSVLLFVTYTPLAEECVQ